MASKSGLKRPAFHHDDLPDMLHSCRICGDENKTAFWYFYSPDDGWRYGWLCKWCADSCRQRGPQPDDWSQMPKSARLAGALGY